MSYIFVDTPELYKQLSDKIESNTGVLFGDIESTGLDFILNKILLFQLMIGDEIFVMDVRKLGGNFLADALRKINKSGHKVVFHNGKFDLKFLYHRTKIWLQHVYDTMISESVLTSGIGKDYYSLEELVEKYTDYFISKEDRKEFIDYPDDKPFTERQLSYAALDVKVLKPIYECQSEEFIRTKQHRVEHVESQLVPIVAKMEYDGIRMDKEEWLKLEKVAIEIRDELVLKFNTAVVDFIMGLKYKNGLELANKVCIPVKTKKLARYLEDITDTGLLRSWIAEHFNVKSPKQLKTLFHLMKIRVKNTNKKTLDDFMDRLNDEDAQKYPILGLLLEIRHVNKQIDQYGSSFLDDIHPVTGKIHTEYSSTGTRTGRFSSRKPNLQNVPVKGGYRECFIPDTGYLFASVDYSQQEYRLAGAVSREPVIIQAYKSGSDMHTATGKIVAKKNEITKEERNRGKTVNFAILYGSTEWGLKNNLRIKLEEAQEIINAFWDGYPKLKDFMDKAGDRILELGYSVTPLGRRRYNTPKPFSGNTRVYMMWQEQVLREGRNHIIQGGGADILKIAMIEIATRNPFGDLLKLTLQIHDELVCQVHKSIADKGLEFIKNTMLEVEQRFLGEIPAAVDGDLKERWSK